MNTSAPPPDSPEATPGNGETWFGDRVPDPAQFFNGPDHARLLELLRHLTENTADVALVVGPPGAGKTTLLFQLQGLAEEHWALCRVDANPMLHPDQLLNRLARHVDAPLSDDPVPDTLAAAFAELRLQGRLPVVLVDDAEQLPISSLLLLMRLHERRAETLPVCALILLAEPAIDAILDSHQVQAMGTARFHRLEMPRLTAEQTPDYVRHFLAMEGLDRDLAFSPAELTRLHRKSEGIPGRINELVISALRESATDGVRMPLPAPLPALMKQLLALSPIQIAALAGLALLVLLGLLFQNGINRLFQSPSGESAPDVRTALPTPTRVRALPLPPRPGPRPGGPSEAESRPGPEPEPEQAQEQEQGQEQESESNWEPLIPPPPPPETPAVATTPQGEPRPAPLSVPAPAAPPRPTPTPAVASVPEAERKTATPPAGEPAAPPPDPKPGPPAAVVEAHGAPPLRDETWLLRRPPDQWTVQILAAGDRNKLRHFIERHRPEGPLAWFETRRNASPWFPLLQGVYPDHAAATAARDALPPALRRSGAWPRSFGSVQQEIRKGGR